MIRLAVIERKKKPLTRQTPRRGQKHPKGHDMMGQNRSTDVEHSLNTATQQHIYLMELAGGAHVQPLVIFGGKLCGICSEHAEATAKFNPPTLHYEDDNAQCVVACQGGGGTLLKEMNACMRVITCPHYYGSLLPLQRPEIEAFPSRSTMQ